MKQNKRIIDRAARKIERENKKLQMSEKKIVNEVKKLAKQGQHKAAKILSKDIVRNRNQVAQYYQMKSQLTALSMKLSTMGSTQELMESMKGASGVMSMVNEKMDMQSIQAVLKEFSKESMKMEMGQEAMADAMDMGMEDVDEEADEVYNAVLGEMGLEFQGDSVPVSQKKIAGQQEEVKQGGANVDDIEARLNALKGM